MILILSAEVFCYWFSVQKCFVCVWWVLLSSLKAGTAEIIIRESNQCVMCVTLICALMPRLSVHCTEGMQRLRLPQKLAFDSHLYDIHNLLAR